MPKLITKFKFMQPGKGKSVGGYAQYIATREGVEMIDDSHRNDPATDRQKKLIQKMLKDFPDAKGSHEYLDFKQQPTMGNASEFISRTLEEHMDTAADTKTYADYIATRPRAERFGTHGLFTDDGESVHLSKVSEELNQHQGNVWTAIISLRREDAERLGFNTGARWRDLLRTQTELLSTNLKIPMNHLRWYAAFHNESHHPHVHLIAYSTDPTEGRLTPKGVENIRSALAKDIFSQDLLCTYQRQTGIRDELRSESRERIAQVVEEINGGVYSNPAVEALLLKLADKLSRTSGKKVYGYLKPDLKAIIDTIVAELAKDERLQELYNLWYEQREEVLRTYTDTLPERIPLEQNKDFKSIRNAVIQEALKIQTIREQEVFAPEAEVPPSPVPVREPPFAPPVDDSRGEKEEPVRTEPRPASRQGHPSVCRVGGRYMATASLRLLQELSRLIQNKTEEQKKNQRVDRKLKRQIEEKKEALGIRGYGSIARDIYGFHISVVDLREPTKSDGNNLLTLINRYMDLHAREPKNIGAKAKAEKYAKILAKTIVNPSGDDTNRGQNAYFYDAAEGLLASVVLLLAEFLPPAETDGIEMRHIASVFKLVQELLAPGATRGSNQFQELMELLPGDHKAKWLAGSALTASDQAMNSVMSTVLSRLNAFLDSELEQVICFDGNIDAELFAKEKSAIFLILPEEDATKNFVASLMIQNLARELFSVANEYGGKLPNRAVFYCDELGTMPPFDILPLFSAGRSRRLSLVPIIQSLAQLEKNYGKEGAEIMQDNCRATRS